MIEQTAYINVDEFHYENSYRRLCLSETGKTKKEMAFHYMWELFVWSAIMGFINNKPVEIRKRYSSPPFRWQIIKDTHQKLLLALAVQNYGSFDILQKPELLKKNLEEFSNGGLDLIHRELALDPLAYQDSESLIFEIKTRLNI